MTASFASSAQPAWSSSSDKSYCVSCGMKPAMTDATDPTRSTSRALSRATFAMLSGGAAAAGSLGAAFADRTDFGRPHAPIVAEDDPEITVGRPAIPAASRTLASYYAAPKNARPAAGVVVVQAIWGIDAQLRDTVRRFAKEGYATIAPDLYTGLVAPNGDGATDFTPFRDVAAKLVDATVDADLGAAYDFLRANSPTHDMRIGVVGFCMGGGIALRQAVDDKRFAAVSVFYGKVRYGTTGNAGAITPIALAYADEIAVPVVGSWGERDTSIVADDVRALDVLLAKRKYAHDVKVYPEAGHAFFDDTRESYVASAASDAWTRTLVWFGQRLK
jgi:carboxymethylenebutenolidase